jgi:predicted PurR-regulated permease PerM
MAQSPGASPGRLTTPVVIGLLAGAGALVAVAGFAGVRRAASVLTMLIAASFLAIGLERRATVVFFCCYQALENWVIYPRVMSRAVEISALAALVSAMVGFAMFGVLGVLLAVPVFGSIQLLVRELVLGRQASR